MLAPQGISDMRTALAQTSPVGRSGLSALDRPIQLYLPDAIPNLFAMQA